VPITMRQEDGGLLGLTPNRQVKTAPKEELDPLNIVSNNTPNTVVDIDEGSGMLSIQSESTTPQSGVNGIVETGGVVMPTDTGMLAAQSQPVAQTPSPEQDATSFLDGSFLSSKVISERGVEEYNTAKSQVDALVSQGKDPSQFDINGAPIGLYGGQVSAKDYLSSIAIPRQDVEQVYDRDTWLNALNAGEELNTTVRDGQTMVLTSAVPEGGYAQFMVEDPSSPLGFAVSPEVKSREAVDAIWRGFAIESGIGDMSANDKMTLAFQNDYYGGDWKQKKDGSWTFELNDPSDLKKFQNVMNPIIKAYASYMLGQAVLPDVTSAVESLNLPPSVTSGISKATSNALIQKATTGEVDLKGVALASLSGAVEGANEAAANAQANLDNLNEIANSNIAGEALIAQTQLASATEAVVKANATAEVLNNIQTTVDIIEAVENKNIIKAVDLGLSMSGSETVSSIVKDNLTTAGVPADYLDTATSTVIKAADTAIKGGDVGDVVQASVNNVLIESVVTEDNIRNTFNLDTTGFDDTLTKTLRSLSVEALEGGNREDILAKGLESFIENLPESTKETPESLQAIENWWHENIEDPFENWWQDIESQRNVVEQAFNGAVETVKQVGQDALDAADAAVRAVPTTKEQWNEVEDAYHENIEDPAEEFVQGLNDGFEGSDSPDVDVETPDVDLDLSLDGFGSGSVGDADIVNVVLEDPELVSGFQYEELYNPLMGERTI
jgi:hypothetical protein